MAVKTADLVAWLAQSEAVLPATAPPVTDFDVIALESLLTAIYNGARITYHADKIEEACAKANSLFHVSRLPADAVARIENITLAALTMPDLDPRSRRLIEEDDWQHGLHELGSTSSWQWRKRLEEAIAANELRLVDAVTGLPISSPAAHITVTTIRAIGPTITTDDLCAGFAGLKFSSTEWRQKINKGPPAWLAKCKVGDGRGGASPAPATWCPIKVALALVAGEPRGEAATVLEVDRAFRTRPELRPCANAWIQYRQDHPALL